MTQEQVNCEFTRIGQMKEAEEKRIEYQILFRKIVFGDLT